MNKVVLRRLESSDQGTFGRLEVNGIVFFTGELPWKDNHSNISCIPAGTYECRQTFSNRFRRNLYLVEHVAGRLGVRIHPANFVGDLSKLLLCQLNGCIALGEKLGIMEGQKAVLVSRPAVEKFETLLGKEPFILEIRDEFG
jgi:hypothetical protein